MPDAIKVEGIVGDLLAMKDDPDFQQRLAEHEAARTDPWKWYCRLCGATGEHAERVKCREEAMAHVASDQPCGRGSQLGQAESGRLLHVWTYA